MPALLFDASFPKSVEQFRSLDLEIWRWSGERLSDQQLLESAHRDGFAGVVFLGDRVLVDSDKLKSLARRLGLYIGVTVEEDPIEAVRAVSNVWSQLLREVGPGKIHLIYARDLRSVE